MSVQEVLASLETTRTIAIRRDTIKACGGDIAMAAMLQQIKWRVDVDRHVERWVDSEGNEWCSATRAELANDLGLSNTQVKRLIEKCRAAGYIEAVQPFIAKRNTSVYVRFPSVERTESSIVTDGIVHHRWTESATLPVDVVLDHSEVEIAADAETDKPPPSVAIAEQPKAPKRNLPYDAIADECGIGLPASRAMSKTIGIALRDILEVSPRLTDEQLVQQIRSRCGVYRRIFHFDLTPLGLAKYWTQCEMTPRSMRAAYSKMDAIERLGVRNDLEEQGYTPEQIKEMTG